MAIILNSHTIKEIIEHKCSIPNGWLVTNTKVQKTLNKN